jgi:hypothetical protein
MRDFLMLLLTAAFFAVCIAYVWWCDRIIGPDPADLSDHDAVPEPTSEFVSPHTSSFDVSGDTNRGGGEVLV